MMRISFFLIVLFGCLGGGVGDCIENERFDFMDEDGKYFLVRSVVDNNGNVLSAENVDMVFIKVTLRSIPLDWVVEDGIKINNNFDLTVFFTAFAGGQIGGQERIWKSKCLDRANISPTGV